MIHPILLLIDQKETGQKCLQRWFAFLLFFLFCVIIFPLEWRILSPCCMQIWSCFSSRVSHDNPHQFGYPRSGFYVFFFSNFTYEIFDHSFPETLFLCYETMIFFPSLSQVFIDAKHSKKKFAAIKLIKNSLQVLTRHNFIQCWFLRKKLQNYFFFSKKS